MHRWNRGGKGDDVVVVFNFSNRSFENYRVGFPHDGDWNLRANTDASTYDMDFGETPAFDTVTERHAYDGMEHSGVVSPPPYTALVFLQ